jgi:photosystem II stability/assembly factor-like uncharacterized protein
VNVVHVPRGFQSCARTVTIAGFNVLGALRSFVPVGPLTLLAVVLLGSPGVASAQTAGDAMPFAQRFLGVNRWVTAVALDPRGDGTIFAAFRSDGVQSSSDGGKSWERVGPGLEEPRSYGPGNWPWEVNALAFNFEEPPRLFAATAGGLFVLTPERYWRQLSLPLPDRSHYVAAVAFDPNAPSVVWASTSRGPFRSVDGGDTWESRCSGLPTDWNPPWDTWVKDLAVVPTDDDSVFACMGTGVFRSRDSGRTWQATAPPRVRPYDRGECTHLAFVPRSSTLLVATGPGVLATSDGGQTWRAGTSFDEPERIFSMVFSATGDDLYAAAYSVFHQYTVWRSRDGARSWDYPRPLAVTHAGALHVAVDPRDPLHVFAGTNLGILESRDGALSWRPTERPGLDILSLAIAPGPHPVAFAGLDRGGVLRSADGGLTWQASGLPARSVTQLLVVPHHPKVILAGAASDGLFRSVDSGVHWEAVKYVNAPTLDCGAPFCPDDVVGLASSQYRHPALYAVTWRRGFLRSDDLGGTWSSAGPVRNEGRIEGIAVDQRDANKVVLAISGGGLLASNDGGRTTHKVVNAELARMGGQGGVVSVPGARGFVAIWCLRVLRSRDGDTWSPVPGLLEVLRAGTQSEAQHSYGERDISRPGPCDSAILATGGEAWSVFAGCEDSLLRLDTRTGEATVVEAFPPLGTADGSRGSFDLGRDIRAVASAGRLVLAANQYGIYRSTDGGSTWKVSLPLWLVSSSAAGQ